MLLIICGLVYPFAMTGLGQLFFRNQAGGSLIYYHGKPIGSALLGQSFTDMRFFHGRDSAVNYNTYAVKDIKPDRNGKTNYTGVSSGSANFAPSNPRLVERVRKDMAGFLKAHPGVSPAEIPTDLLTSSGSGLDPHISPAAARVQIPAIVLATGMNRADLERIISRATEDRLLGIFGEPRVNVLKANLAIAGRLKLEIEHLRVR
jgi:K+-transporting ATPase ATPase C chain